MSPVGGARKLLPMNTTADVIQLDDVRKVYGHGEGAVVALAGVTLGFQPGSFTALMGPSGSGKSTFLHVAAGLDTPSAGQVRLGGVELAGQNETQLTELRRSRVGFVFQAFNLLPALTVAQNIALPLRLGKQRLDKAWLREVVQRTGLAERMRHRPAGLSGGEQQGGGVAGAPGAR